jgi:para-nitrobenzyl esterase
MSEDCLYLNIWAPERQSAQRYPVMVWIYGGGFVGGTAAVPYYDGTSLAREGAIVVTFNYRTNIFGFFSHPGLSQESPTHTSGNYGLLDMLAALKWVKQNIASFGGDPDRVTVFGESAGASAIGLLLTSPLSRGLFDGAILESPGLMRPLATLSESEAAGAELGDDLSQLRAMDPKTLMDHAASAIPASRKLEKPRPVGPIIDGTVLPQSDAQAMAGGDLDRVPVLIGSNADEGRLFVQLAPPIKTVAEYQSYLKTQFGASAGRMAECYPVASDDDVMPAVSKIFGDNQFNRGITTFSNALSALGLPVFRYRFDGLLGPGRKPATHGGEIPYVFDAFSSDELAIFSGMGLINLGSSGVTAEDHALSRQMSSAWINFAAQRNPNGSGVPDWPAYKPDGTIMVFGSQSGAKESAQLGNACQSADRPK